MAAGDSSSSSRFRSFNKLLQFDSKPPPLPPKDPIYRQHRAPTNQPRTSTEASTPLGSEGSGSPSISTFPFVSPATEADTPTANSPLWLHTTATCNPSASGAHYGPNLNVNTKMNWSTTTLSLAQGNDVASSHSGASHVGSNTGMRLGATGTMAKNPLGFLKFPKRSPRIPSSVDNAGDPPPPKEDEGISLPWNFQHNIHVDEGYVGLPPSWLTSAGFTEGELVDIQARRTRSPPHLRYLYSERPRTPAPSNSHDSPESVQALQRTNSSPFPPGHLHGDAPHSTMPMHGTPIIKNPTPRSTSLAQPSVHAQNYDNSPGSHKRNQLSASTELSADSHMVTGTSSSNHSTVPSGSTSPSSHSAKDDERSVANGVTLNPLIVKGQGPGSLDTISDGTVKEKKPFWGRPRLKSVKVSTKDSPSSPLLSVGANFSASSSTPNLSLLSSAPMNATLSSNSKFLSPSSSNLTSTSATSLIFDTLAQTLSTPPPHQTTHAHAVGTWTAKSKAKVTASTLAAAGSSLVDTLRSSAVAAAGAGKGVWRIGRKGSIAPQSVFEGERPIGERAPVSQSYTQAKGRPRTAGSTSETGSGVSSVQASPPLAGKVDASPESSPAVKLNISRSDSLSLSRQGSMSRRSRSLGSLRSQKSQRSQRLPKTPSINCQLLQDSMQAVPRKGQGKSPSKVHPQLGHHPKSGSVTSLDSIPEASPAPGAVVVLAGNGERRGPAAASSGTSGVVAALPASGSGYVNDKMSSEGRKLSFSSGSTVADVSGSGAGRSSSCKGRHQPNLHQNDSSASSISAKSSSSSLKVNGESALPTRPPPPPGSPLGLDAVLFSSSPRAPPPPARPPPPPGSPLGLNELHFQKSFGEPSFASSSLNASTSTNSPSVVRTSIDDEPPSLTTAPPRLSLHQHLVDSSESWSAALLTGLSLSHAGTWEEETHQELSLDDDLKEKEYEMQTTSKPGDFALRNGERLGPATAPLSSDFWEKSIFRAQQQQGFLQQQQQGLRQPSQTHFHSKSLTTSLEPSPGSMGTATSSTANPGTSNTTTTLSTTTRRKNGQPLPLSKPPPRHPAPDPPIGLLGPTSLSSKMMMPVQPIPLGLTACMGVNPSGIGCLPHATSNSNQESTSATMADGNVNTPPPQVIGLLSPATGMESLTPPDSASIRVVSPNSAQLWDEIEQMMDAEMISNIPGLHLSTALPPSAKEVLRSAGIGAGFPSQATGKSHGHTPVPGEPKTVGDLVGRSPPLLPTRIGTDQDEEVNSDDDNDYDSDSMEDDVDLYDGVIQSAIARPVEPLTLRAGGPLGHEGQQDADQGIQHLGVKDRLTHNRDSQRSSTATITVAGLASPPKIVRAVSIVRRADAYVIDRSRDRSPGPSEVSRSQERSGTPGREVVGHVPAAAFVDPVGSESSDSGGSGSSGSPSMRQPTLMSDAGIPSPLLYYLDAAQTPSPTTPSSAVFHQLPSPKEFQSVHEIEYKDEGEEYLGSPHVWTPPDRGSMLPRPTIVLNDDSLVEDIEQTDPNILTAASGAPPLSPFQHYRGWLSDIVAPLEEFIDEAVDPREHYLDLNEIAEGESGSVFAARLNPENAEKLRLPPLVKALDGNDIASGQVKLVAIKNIAIVPSGSPKLVDLHRELTLMKGLGHPHVLVMDAVYVDLIEDSLWVRMELMERSLADIIGLVDEGLMLQERMIARFASDVLLALDYLLNLNIAHRDLRSDNLLLNRFGILKLADFSNAACVTSENPMREDVVGVAFWQAPEVKRGPYNILKIDVWSLGATAWEMAETEPPFYGMAHTTDRWPPLSKPEVYSPAFHDFLRKCSEPATSRPSASQLLKTSFINNSCGRPVIVQLLSQCMAIEGSSGN